MHQEVGGPPEAPEGRAPSSPGALEELDDALASAAERSTAQEDGAAAADILVIEHDGAAASSSEPASDEEEAEEEAEQDSAGAAHWAGNAAFDDAGPAAAERASEDGSAAAAEELAALALGGTPPAGSKRASAAAGGGGGEEGSSPAGNIKAHHGLASAPSSTPSAAASGRSRVSSKRLTFTAPPKCLQNKPRPAARFNFSHSQPRVAQILRDNETLVKRLGKIAAQRPQHETDQAKHDQFLANVAATSAARRAGEARRVMAQNLRIYSRLQAIKPSRDVARAQQDRDFAKHSAMLATLAALRRRSRQPASAPRGGKAPRASAAAGAGASSSWDA